MKIQGIQNNNYTSNSTNFKAKRIYRLQNNCLTTKAGNNSVVDVLKLNPREDFDAVAAFYDNLSSYISKQGNLSKNKSLLAFLNSVKTFFASFIVNSKMQEQGIDTADKDYFLGLKNGDGLSFGYTLSNKKSENVYQETFFSKQYDSEDLNDDTSMASIFSVIKEVSSPEYAKAKNIVFNTKQETTDFFHTIKEANDIKNRLTSNVFMTVDEKNKKVENILYYIKNIQLQ